MKLKGKVVKGAGLGFKTANLSINKSFELADGVYFAKVNYDGQEYQAIAIMGIRQDIEVYLLDFEGDLYDQILEVEVLEKIRDLVQYNTEEGLRQKIEEDVEKAKKYFIHMD